MGNQKVREKKKPTFFLAVLPILAMIYCSELVMQLWD